MDRKLLIKRAEIVIAVLLIVVVVLGILFFAFRAIPITNPALNNTTSDLFPGLPADPNEMIKFLDLNGQTEFVASNKKVILPTDGQVSSAYNNTSLSQFTCQSDTSTDCTIYEISTGGRTFYIASPLLLKLKQPTSSGSIKKTLTVSGENLDFTYTQKKYYNAKTDDAGLVTESIEDPSLTTIEEIYGCTSVSICFNSGKLSDDKASNENDIAAFEAFVQAIVIQ